MVSRSNLAVPDLLSAQWFGAVVLTMNKYFPTSPQNVPSKSGQNLKMVQAYHQSDSIIVLLAKFGPQNVPIKPRLNRSYKLLSINIFTEQYLPPFFGFISYAIFSCRLNERFYQDIFQKAVLIVSISLEFIKRFQSYVCDRKRI